MDSVSYTHLALKNEGIASVLHNENMSSVMRGYVRDVTGVDIFVSLNHLHSIEMCIRDRPVCLQSCILFLL